MSAPIIHTVTDDNIKEIVLYLCNKDPDLHTIYTSYGVPPLWNRTPGFKTLTHIILEQQVSLLSAKAVFERLEQLVSPYSPETFATLGVPWFREHGVTRQKARYLVILAEAIIGEGLDLDRLHNLPDDEIFTTLTSITGIGPWTAQIYLLMAVCRPDIWPHGDLALKKALADIKNLRNGNGPLIADITDSWRPFRAVAARLLWHYYLSIRTDSQ